jgi:hypothetical protein
VIEPLLPTDVRGKEPVDDGRVLSQPVRSDVHELEPSDIILFRNWLLENHSV